MLDVDELEGVLSELRQGGTLESSGRFTIDLATARERLRHYQLPDRCWYVLKLVQAAVASKAGHCEITCSGGGLSFSHDGKPLPVEQLHDLFGCLLGRTATEPAWTDLAMAVNAALGFPRVDLLVESVGQEGGSWLRLGPEGAQFGLLPGQERARTRITVRRPLGWSEWLRRKAPEEVVLRERACWAPLELRLNGKPVERAFGVHSGLSKWRIGWSGKDIGLCVPLDSGCQDEYVINRRFFAFERRLREGPGGGLVQLGEPRSGQLAPNSDPSQTCRAALALYVDPALAPVLRWVHRGVLVGTTTDWVSGFSGEMVLAADDLATDLGGFTLREEAAWQGRLRWAAVAAGNLQHSFEKLSEGHRLEDALVRSATRKPALRTKL